MTTDPNIPTVREELERKTLDELVRLAHCVQEGHVLEGEYALAAQAIWNITSGLVPLETGELVAHAAGEFPPPVRNVVFFKDGDVYQFAWKSDKDNFGFIKRGLSFAKTEVKRIPVDRIDRKAHLEKLFAALTKAGWARLC